MWELLLLAIPVFIWFYLSRSENASPDPHGGRHARRRRSLLLRLLEHFRPMTLEQERAISAFRKYLADQNAMINIVKVDNVSQFVRDVTLFTIEVPNEILENLQRGDT